MFGSAASSPMGQIRDGLARLRTVDRSGWSNPALSAEVEELAAIVERVEAELVRLVGQWNAAAVWADDGALSGAAWLATHTPTTRPAAARLVRTARLVHDREATAKALDVGDVTVAHVEVLAGVVRGREGLYAEHEDTLLRAAGTAIPDDFVVAAQRWRALADDELARLDAAAVFEHRHLHVSPTMGGGAISGFLDPEATATLIEALDSLEPPDPIDALDGVRSLSQRRADALVTMCEMTLSNPERGRDSAAGVDVVSDLDALLDRGAPRDILAARSDIGEQAVLARSALERILCDSPVGRALLRGKSETIDLGRRSRVASPALRRSIKLRDGHCQFPGCRAPDRWCDVHHLVHWLDGGETSETNCVLLCRRHHVLLHEGGWRLRREPDGTVGAERRPQRLRARRSRVGRAPPRIV